MYAYVPLLSFSILLFEITLTRLLAYAYSSHLTPVVVSLALCGLGAGSFCGARFFSKTDDRALLSAGFVAIAFCFPLAYAALLYADSFLLVVVCSLLPFLGGGL